MAVQARVGTVATRRGIALGREVSLQRADMHTDARVVDLSRALRRGPITYLGDQHRAVLDRAFVFHRALAVAMFDYAQSGHPGGSISSARQLLGAFLGGTMAYDIADPWRRDADIAGLAAGHKAMGWYAFNALLNEAVRQAQPELLPTDMHSQLRFEDLLGFRKNPSVQPPLRAQFGSRELDGHPTPETPFTFVATGASGVGVGSVAGLAWAARDVYRAETPVVYCFEGEGGMTPGRVDEVLEIVRRADVDNFVMVVDHNDASIDVARLCAGDYTWVKPEQRAMLKGMNVVIADGRDFDQVMAAYDYARQHLVGNGRPTMIVFKTEKGEGYGKGTNASHGAGHPRASEAYFKAQEVFEQTFGVTLPRPTPDQLKTPESIEQYFWDALQVFRQALSNDAELAGFIADRVAQAKADLDARNARRAAVPGGEKMPLLIEAIETSRPDAPPPTLQLAPGASMPIRQALALGLGDINVRSSGGVLFAAADLYGSGSLNAAVPFVPNDREHLDSRALATGITEDGTSAFMAGVSTFGRHIGAEFSYGAFMTPMGWTAARLHAIGYDASGRRHGMPMMLICGHAGPATGEDGPTHADPASLSQWYSMQGMNGLMLDLTPGTNEDVWPLLVAALQRDPRPAVIGAFVTRPNFRVVDRAALGMADPLAGMSGIYRLAGPTEGRVPAAHVVLQGAGVLDELLQNGGEALTAIRRLDPGVDVHYVTSRLMFDALPRADRGRLWSPQMAVSAMGVTDFTADTMDGWITSSDGREATLSPHKGGHFLRSGIGSHVLKEGGLSADQIVDSVSRFVQQQATAALL